MKKTLIAMGLLCQPLSLLPALITDNAHFYRATYFYGEPRLERKGLTTLETFFAGGSTCQGRDHCGNKVCLLDIYGHENMQRVGQGVPNLNPANPIDAALIDLARLPARGDFGQLIFQGRFSIKEAGFAFLHNFGCGLFFRADVPWRKLKISCIQYKDLSPTDNIFPNINTPEWQTFLNQFTAMLARYDLSIAPICKSGVGDAAFLIGWTNNYQETEELDFVDMTMQVGVLAPTGKEQCASRVFDLPLGYNGHIGFPIKMDVSFGAYDWFTFGFHLGVIPFANKSHTLQVKTDINQRGYIKLARACACVNQGPLWEAGLYAKADHICHGFSFGAAYSFAHQNASTVTPRSSVFTPSIVNTDSMFHAWSMSTLNFMAEYDFAKEDSKWGPRLGIFYNREVGGKRTFNTSMVGGSFGLDIAIKLD